MSPAGIPSQPAQLDRLRAAGGGEQSLASWHGQHGGVPAQVPGVEPGEEVQEGQEVTRGSPVSQGFLLAFLEVQARLAPNTRAQLSPARVELSTSCHHRLIAFMPPSTPELPLWRLPYVLCKKALAWHSKRYNPEGARKAGTEAVTRGSVWLATSSFFIYLQGRSVSVQQTLAPILALVFLTVTLSLSVPVCKTGCGGR